MSENIVDQWVEKLKKGEFLSNIEFCILVASRTEYKTGATVAAAELQDITAKLEAVELVLNDVNTWMQNWEPDFTDDPEWEETQKRIDEILKVTK